jgi:hypothetical protein
VSAAKASQWVSERLKAQNARQQQLKQPDKAGSCAAGGVRWGDAGWSRKLSKPSNSEPEDSGVPDHSGFGSGRGVVSTPGLVVSQPVEEPCNKVVSSQPGGYSSSDSSSYSKGYSGGYPGGHSGSGPRGGDMILTPLIQINARYFSCIKGNWNSVDLPPIASCVAFLDPQDPQIYIF